MNVTKLQSCWHDGKLDIPIQKNNFNLQWPKYGTVPSNTVHVANLDISRACMFPEIKTSSLTFNLAGRVSFSHGIICYGPQTSKVKGPNIIKTPAPTILGE